MNLTMANMNPFRHAVAADPWQSATADVPEIHQQALVRCQQALAETQANGGTAAVLLYGEPGSGKTHLLARLRAWLAPAGAPPRGLFISVPLLAGPRMIWRYLRKRIATDLLRPLPASPDGGVTQLDELLLRHLTDGHDADRQVLWDRMKTMARQNNLPADELESLFDQLETRMGMGMDLNLRTVISHLFLQRHLRESRAWLYGNALPDAALERLGIAQAENEDNAEDQARDTVLTLCALARREMPIVLCFDQVESLQMHPGDLTGLFAFGQVLMSLYHGKYPLALISCIQSEFQEPLRAAVSGAAWHRITSDGTVLLPSLTRDQAERLARARVDSLPELASQRPPDADVVWPLVSADIDAALDTGGRCTPRKLLGHCAERFAALHIETHQGPRDQDTLKTRFEHHQAVSLAR
ncbi:MAG: ATP-binding protein, partial [Blastocatellia bacterium]